MTVEEAEKLSGKQNADKKEKPLPPCSQCGMPSKLYRISVNGTDHKMCESCGNKCIAAWNAMIQRQ
jgi:uncharacterized paraquat-inducible protein A